MISYLHNVIDIFKLIQALLWFYEATEKIITWVSSLSLPLIAVREYGWELLWNNQIQHIAQQVKRISAKYSTHLQNLMETS